MSSEKTLLTTHHQCDDRAGQGTVVTSHVSAFKSSPPLLPRTTHLPTGGLFNLSCSFAFACSLYDLLLGFTALPARSLEAKERLNIMLEVEDQVVSSAVGCNTRWRCERWAEDIPGGGYFVNERWVVG